MALRALALISTVVLLTIAAFAQSALPSGPLAMRDFRLQFDPSGTFSLTGAGWPAMSGSWKMSGAEITLLNQPGPAKCDTAARYTLAIEGSRVGLDVIADDCQPRRMILDRSRWLPPGTETAAARRIVRTAGPVRTPLRAVTLGAGDWPSFRGREASGVKGHADDPERPVFAVKPGARGDLTLAKDATANASVVWSKTGRGSYMSTPLAYRAGGRNVQAHCDQLDRRDADGDTSTLRRGHVCARRLDAVRDRWRRAEALAQAAR